MAYETIAQRLRARRPLMIRRELLDELCLVGDVACDAGLLRPGIAFAVYRKRR